MSHVKRRLQGITNEELDEDLSRIEALRRIYRTTKVEYAAELAKAAIKDELVRRDSEDKEALNEH